MGFAATLALTLASPNVSAASPVDTESEAPVFVSAPELGDAEDILSRTPEENYEILARLPDERRESALDEAGANDPTPLIPVDGSGPDKGQVSPDQAGSNRTLANRLMFNQSLQYFINFRAWYHKDYPGLEWSSDACSVPFPLDNISSAYMKAFQNPCVRHDFGYRNYGAKSALKLAPTEEGRKIIDDKFLADMQGVAAATPDAPLRESLYVGALAFHSAVRLRGGAHY
ncbi:MAG: phospholipase A2 [Dermatophilus congolensis]|nr:phospholipase A2 [Dermatophilus congolensis]